MDEIIYFDNCATTRLDKFVMERMIPYMTKFYANPASQHYYGKEMNEVINERRNVIAKLLDCNDDEIVFTSGATESINIALKGLALHAANNKNKIITSQTEHKAVLDTCKYLEGIGFEIYYLPVDEFGLINISDLEYALDNETLAVCLMMVNNETGTIQPIQDIARICHNKGIIVICDATQAIGKITVNLKELNVDLMMFSGHKIHGPKGIGVLYVRRGISITEVVHGGGHEHGLRSGTLNVPAIIGLTSALELALENLIIDQLIIRQLRDTLEETLLSIPGTVLNGHPLTRVSNISNIYFPGIDANTFITEIRSMAVSNGSACTSAVFTPSHVLKAMGLSDEQAFGSIRFSFSKYNTLDEVHKAVEIIKDYLKSRFLPL